MRKIALLVLLFVLVGCKLQVQKSFYKSSGMVVDTKPGDGNGNHKRSKIFVEAEVLEDLRQDNKAFVVIEINDEGVPIEDRGELQRIIRENRNQILKTLANNQIKVINILGESNAFTAEITSEALETLQSSPYVEAIKTVKVVNQRRY